MKTKGPAQVRIIGGLWKRTPIRVVDAEGLRPTPDRVRETLFNWLGPHVEGADCLDLFAGTGALGFEAASRGARRVVLVENSKAAQQQQLALKTRLGANQVELLAGDAIAALTRFAREQQRFDLVFLDPPFGRQWVEKVLPLLPALLQPGALVYLESETAFTVWQASQQASQPRAAAWNAVKAAKAGQVHYHLLQLHSTPIPSEAPREN